MLKGQLVLTGISMQGGVARSPNPNPDNPRPLNLTFEAAEEGDFTGVLTIPAKSAEGLTIGSTYTLTLGGR